MLYYISSIPVRTVSTVLSIQPVIIDLHSQADVMHRVQYCRSIVRTVQYVLYSTLNKKIITDQRRRVKTACSIFWAAKNKTLTQTWELWYNNNYYFIESNRINDASIESMHQSNRINASINRSVLRVACLLACLLTYTKQSLMMHHILLYNIHPAISAIYCSYEWGDWRLSTLV